MSKDSHLTRMCSVMVQNHTCICDILCKTVDTAPSAPLHFPQVPEAVNHKIEIKISLQAAFCNCKDSRMMGYPFLPREGLAMYVPAS